MEVEKLIKAYENFREGVINNRTITPEQVFGLCQTSGAKTVELGKSVLGHPICSLEVGNGKKRVLLWTQMHGNEPTATAAVFDLLRFLRERPSGFEALVDGILAEFRLVFIPMLNPDGALLYRRTNAMDIDLNRDALALSTPESRILRAATDAFRPQYCFNLHDQRNIYNIAGTAKTATISFLAPAEDEQRSVTSRRRQSMAIVNAMNQAISGLIPGCVGRYSDEFYPTATGDNFQKDGYVTMLIESGAYPGDPERQVARKCNFTAILSALEFLMETDDLERGWERYDLIPPNGMKMMDIIVRGAQISLGNCQTTTDIGILFLENPSADRARMECRAIIESIGDLRYYYGMEEILAEGKKLAGYGDKCPQTGDEITLPIRLE